MSESVIERPSQSELRSSSVLPPLEQREQLYFALRALAVLNVICLGFMMASRRLIDYGSFYAVGRIVHVSPELLYDAATQRAMQLRLFPGSDGWIAFYHPPVEMLIFGPLAYLPYSLSLAVWTAMSAGLLLLSVKLLSPVFGMKWWRLLIVAFALFPTCGVFWAGQDTFLLLAILSAALLFASREKDTMAGMVLALGLFKPQIPLVIAAAFLLQRRRRLAGSFCASAGVIGLASIAYMGRVGVERLRAMIRTVEPMDRVGRMPSIRGILSLVHAPQSLTIILSVLLLAGFAIRWYRSEPRLMPMFSSAILVGTLVAYHFHAYDQSVLLIPVVHLLLTDRSRIKLAAILAIAASPLFFLLLVRHCIALLAIPVVVLALYRGRPVPEMPQAGSALP